MQSLLGLRKITEMRLGTRVHSSKEERWFESPEAKERYLLFPQGCDILSGILNTWIKCAVHARKLRIYPSFIGEGVDIEESAVLAQA